MQEDSGAFQPLPGGVNSIRAYQWNPHWTCTQHRACAEGAEASLDDVLVRGRVDFANVIYLRDLEYRPRGVFKALVKSCARDSAWLIYNSHVWEPRGNGQTGCLEEEDRAFVVQTFTHIYHAVSLVVVGAHYSHNAGSVENLRAAILLERQVLNVGQILVAADLNGDWSIESYAMLQALGVPVTETIQKTQRVQSCCQDDGFQQSFDRILTNFGTHMETQMLHDPTPSWAQGKFHKGVLAQLTFGGSVPEESLEVAPQGRPLGQPDLPQIISVEPVATEPPALNGEATQPLLHQSEGRVTVIGSEMRNSDSTPAQEGWKLHQGANCYAGSGAESLPMETVGSLVDCQSACLGKHHASCEGIVMTAATEQGSCWPVRSVRLSQCARDVVYNLWLRSP